MPSWQLGRGMSGFGGAAEPGCRLLRVPLAPGASHQVAPDDKLRGDDARLGGGAVAAVRLLAAWCVALTLGIELPELQQCRPVAAIRGTAQQALCFLRVAGNPDALQMQRGQHGGGVVILGRGGTPQPFRRLRQILRHAVAAGEVEPPQPGLRPRHALLGGAAEPYRGLCRIPLDPGAVEAEYSHVELREDMPLLGRPCEPARGVLDALRHALAASVQRAERKLRLRIADLGGGAIPLHLFHLTAVQAGQVPHRCGVTRPCCQPKMAFGHDPVLRHPIARQHLQREVKACLRVTLLGRLLKQRSGPRRIAHDAPPAIEQQSERDLRIVVAAGRRLFVPPGGDRQIGFDAVSVGVNDPQAEFARRVALFRRKGIPAKGFGVIGLAADPARVHVGDLRLRLGKALFRRVSATTEGFARIRRDRDPVREHQLAVAFGDVLVHRGGPAVPVAAAAARLAAAQIGEAQPVLRLSMALLRRPAEPHDGVAQAADDTLAARVEETKAVLPFGVARRGSLREAARRLGKVACGVSGEPGPYGAAAGSARLAAGNRRRRLRAHASPRSRRALRH